MWQTLTTRDCKGPPSSAINIRVFGMVFAGNPPYRHRCLIHEFAMTKNIFRLLFALTLSGMAAPGLAGTNIDDQSTSPRVTPPCPGLMTQQECAQHQATVAKLGSEPALESYLAEFEAKLRDRDTACSCNRKLPPESQYITHRQTLLDD
jgi:hypothetical protein